MESYEQCGQRQSYCFLCTLDTIHFFFVTRLIISKINKVQCVHFKLENVLVPLHSLKTMGIGSIIFKEWSYLDILLYRISVMVAIPQSPGLLAISCINGGISISPYSTLLKCTKSGDWARYTFIKSVEFAGFYDFPIWILELLCWCDVLYFSFLFLKAIQIY